MEIAEGGDLFLDEIGEMPIDVQALFLTFLDSMEYYRLGEDRKRKANVRIICATNRDLKGMIQDGTFRKDLYSRISQVLVEVPSLRDRSEDIPLLFEFFINEFLGYQKSFEPEVLEYLKELSWTEGNVREFRDAVEYICVVSQESDTIRMEHVSENLSRGTDKGEDSAEGMNSKSSDSNMSEVYNVGLETYLTEIEKEVLSRLYASHDGNVNDLAEKVRVSRPTLYRKLKKHSVL